MLGLYPLLPDKVEVDRDGKGELYYVYNRYSDEKPNFEEYGRVYLAPEDVLHIPGLGFDGLVGYSPMPIRRPGLLPDFPKLCVEPVPFREIEMDFGFGEKVLVILYGLPVPDHRVYLLVVICAVHVGHRRFFTTRGAFGDRSKWSPNAPHILTDMSILFKKFKEIFLRDMEEEKKEGTKKGRKIGL